MTAKIRASEWRGSTLVVTLCANVEGHVEGNCPWDFGPVGYERGVVSRPETADEQSARVTAALAGVADTLLQATPPPPTVDAANPTGLDGTVLGAPA